MGRWPPAPWAGPCCTQSCERRSTWREQPRWESEATTRRLRSLSTCFFLHLFTCWFAATYSPWPAWHNKRRGIRHRSWKQRVHGQNRNEFQTIQKSLYVNSWSFWTQRVWVKWLDLAAMPMERRHGKRDSQVPPLELDFCDQYSIYEICNMQYASNSIFCQPLYKVV